MTRRPGRSECGDLRNTACSVYRELASLELPEVMPARQRRSLDAVIEHKDGTLRVFEVDEAQHFDSHRALTLERYPRGTALAFDSRVWHRWVIASIKLRGGGWGRAKPPLFPRLVAVMQRAFRDMLADLLPPSRGWSPTLPIAHFEVEESLDAPDAEHKMRALLKRKFGVEDLQAVR